MRYAPYLTLRSTPLDWITFLGDVRTNFLHYDTQNVCHTTCSLEPSNVQKRVLTSAQGNLILHPWHDTDIFINVGTGYHSFQDREPIGSTTVEQLSQVISYQIGLRFALSQETNVSASLWQVNLNSDRIFFGEGGEAQITGSSTRRGIQLKGNISMPKDVLIFGNIAYGRSTLRRSGERILLAPAVTIEAAVNKNWGQRWASTFLIRHIGQRRGSDNTGSTLPPFTSFDLTTNYQFKESATQGRAEVFLGVINVSNSYAPYSQLFFDTGWESEYSQVFNINYFPGQSRTIIGGMTWDF